ncbi:hypothetical protein [Cellulomonas sp.]|uniref:hypothetical protein n=1 Tax=Cellulomonas sp. TaxID=40001 RepID=UPI001B07B7CB|nr:hypothetical protein [Cellulomonas sp.]MBO9556824.1 hypothetical protein [Cellulomonas sp.]
MARLSWAVPAAVLVAALVACAPAARPPTEAELGPGPGLSDHVVDGPVSLRLPDGTEAVPTSVALASARVAVEGGDYTVLSRTPADDTLLGLDVLPTGDLVALRVPENQYQGGDGVAVSSVLGTYDGHRFDPWPGTGRLVPGDPPRQVYGADAGQGAVAWAETASIRLDRSSWRVFARDDAGRTSLVATSEEVIDGPMPVLNDDARPVVADGRVYWATPAPAGPGSDQLQMQVVSRDIGGGGPLTVGARGAARPAVGDHGVYVVRTYRDDPTVPDGRSVVAVATGGGDTAPLLTVDGPPGVNVVDLVADGSRLAFVTSAPSFSTGTVYVHDPVSGRLVAVPTAGAGQRTELALCGDRLVWTTNDGSGVGAGSVFVLDVATLDLREVEVQGGYGTVMCAGDVVAWQALPSPDGFATTTVVRWG